MRAELALSVPHLRSVPGRDFNEPSMAAPDSDHADSMLCAWRTELPEASQMVSRETTRAIDKGRSGGARNGRVACIQAFEAGIAHMQRPLPQVLMNERIAHSLDGVTYAQCHCQTT